MDNDTEQQQLKICHINLDLRLQIATASEGRDGGRWGTKLFRLPLEQDFLGSNPSFPTQGQWSLSGATPPGAFFVPVITHPCPPLMLSLCTTRMLGGSKPSGLAKEASLQLHLPMVRGGHWLCRLNPRCSSCRMGLTIRR